MIFLNPLATNIFTLSGVFSLEECEALIQKGETMGFEKATVHTSSGAVDLPGVRNNDRVIWDDVAYASEIFARVVSYLPETSEGQQPIGLNERWRFYRYGPGQRFKRHRDGVLALPPRVVEGVKLRHGQTRYTFMLYLNEGCEGGETQFYRDSGLEFLQVQPEVGQVLIFAHEILHEGCVLQGGQKYVLRTDVIYEF
jgi:prolyl 4-hydroxylase